MHSYMKQPVQYIIFQLQAGPTSCSTVFNESVLGPIQKRNIITKRQPYPEECSPPQTTPQLATGAEENGGVGLGGKSAFEKMMNTFDAFEKTMVLPVQDGSVDHLLPSNEGAGGSTIGCGEGKECIGEMFGVQSKMWKDFISGCTTQPAPVS